MGDRELCGCQVRCSSCAFARFRKRRPQRTAAYDMRKAAKRRAKKKDIEFELCTNFIEAICPTHCPVLGLELNYAGGKMHESTATLDRILPEHGYIPGNVAVISARANRIKNDGTAEEHRKIAEYITRWEVTR